MRLTRTQKRIVRGFGFGFARALYASPSPRYPAETVVTIAQFSPALHGILRVENTHDPYH
jgi:hypothetical protein